MKDNYFLIRVYGIFIDPINGLLVSDENVKGDKVTKFPGGGLEYGEGTIDCLLREMVEETGCVFKVISHFYTTDYFVESAFHKNKQVISIYYLIEPADEFSVKISDVPFDFESNKEGGQSFRFMPIDKIDPEQFTLTIDRQVALLLAQNYKRF